jgi:hypothetical protein
MNCKGFERKQLWSHWGNTCHLPVGDEEEYEALSRDSHVPAKIQTKHLLMMSQVHYHQANHFGDYNLLVCDTVYFDRQVPMSHGNIPPQTSGRNDFVLHINGVPYYHGMMHSQTVDWQNSLQTCKVLVNIQNKQTQMADKGWSFSLRDKQENIKFHTEN